MYLQGKERASKQTKRNLKNFKKVLDKQKALWYNKYIR